jgi:hypothetical protein
MFLRKLENPKTLYVVVRANKESSNKLCQKIVDLKIEGSKLNLNSILEMVKK